MKMMRRGKRRLTIAIELPFSSVFPSGVATVPVDVTWLSFVFPRVDISTSRR